MPKRHLQIHPFFFTPYNKILASAASVVSQTVLWPIAGTHMLRIVKGQGVVFCTLSLSAPAEILVKG